MPGPGTKVNDPHNEIREGTGGVASDALAAESNRSGGGFSENPGSAPLSDSAFANSNTSGARKNPPSTDAEARDPDVSYSGEQSGSKAEGFSKPTSNTATAPGYINALYVDGGLPKGKNLTEGGFESYTGKNASFNQEIGGKNDPGRLAEAKFARDNADASGGSAGLPMQKGDIGENTYDALDRKSSA